MSISTLKGKCVPIELWAPIDEVESKALDQLKNIAALPWVFRHVAAMPDCLDEDTEVLTPTGWRRIAALTQGDVIVAFDPTTRQCLVECCSGVLIRPLRPDERVFDFSFPFHNLHPRSIVATQGHRMALASNMGTKAADLAQSSTVIGDYVWHGDGFAEEASIFSSYEVDEFRLFAWLLGDGYIKVTHNQASNNYRWGFGFKKERKIKRLSALLQRLGLTFHTGENKHQTQIIINTVDSVRYLEALNYSKGTPWGMLTAPKDKILSFLDEAIYVDGDYEAFSARGAVRYNTSSRDMADFFAALAVTTKGASGFYSREIKNAYGEGTAHIVSVTSNLLDNRSGIPNRKVKVSEVPYAKNTVVCLSCPSTFFVARQGRTVFITGNCHFGYGATVGSVIAMKGAVSPAAVGVDIGCGVHAVKTNLTASDLPDSLDLLRSRVERDIPVGFNKHDSVCKYAEKHSLWKEFHDLTEKVQDKLGRARKQMGTLGGGNHFIELCIDTEQNVWLMLHSGSRNIGKSLAEIHMGRAKKLTHNAALPDKDLAVFLAGTPEMGAYRRDLFWAQRYAKANREVILKIYAAVIHKMFKRARFEAPVSCHHNYVAEEVHFGEEVMVTRKGAISAREGEMGIIPGSMGTRSYIVRGKGNPESFNSASHGAGRRMSRGAAKRLFTQADIDEQTEGVCCRKDMAVRDELPGAYKDIEKVMANQQDLVEIVAELKQVMCIKG